MTYLFDGEIDRRDSLGSFQTIRPGDVSWMLAGRGIVHSERTGPEPRARGSKRERSSPSTTATKTGERHIEWSFVSSSKDRIEQAKRDWKERRFPKVPGDEAEYVPLPERRP